MLLVRLKKHTDHRLAGLGWKLGLLVCLGLSTLVGCQTLRQMPANPLPVTYELTQGQIVLHSESSLDKHQKLIDQLSAQREQLATKLGLPKTEVPIHIYLFADATKYYDFLELRFPGFSTRRAIFVETDVELVIYAYWGEHVAEDLRHEVTHGYLHAALPHLPLWLDEGLAEYFEVGSHHQGLNITHLEYLAAPAQKSWQPNLARLEQLSVAATMTQQDYAESWAWVHFLLESEVDKTHVLVDYLADLQQGVKTHLSTELKKRLARPELALAEYLHGLR